MTTVTLSDTVNRTLQSRLIVIELLQEWRWTALMPPRLHDCCMCIRQPSFAEYWSTRPHPAAPSSR